MYNDDKNLQDSNLHHFIHTKGLFNLLPFLNYLLIYTSYCANLNFLLVSYPT